MTTAEDTVPTDRALLDAAIAGDEHAFGDLFRRHATAVYNHCFRQLGTWSAAEDAVSVVFLETWRRRRDARDVDGSLRPWLLVVATNVARNHARTSRRHKSAMGRLQERPTPNDHAETVTDRLAAEQRVREVNELLRRLTPHEHEAVALCVWSELTYEEASAALGVPTATIRSRLARARTRLRALTPPLDEPPAAAASVARAGTTRK